MRSIVKIARLLRKVEKDINQNAGMQVYRTLDRLTITSLILHRCSRTIYVFLLLGVLCRNDVVLLLLSFFLHRLRSTWFPFTTARRRGATVKSALFQATIIFTGAKANPQSEARACGLGCLQRRNLGGLVGWRQRGTGSSRKEEASCFVYLQEICALSGSFAASWMGCGSVAPGERLFLRKQEGRFIISEYCNRHCNLEHSCRRLSIMWHSRACEPLTPSSRKRQKSIFNYNKKEIGRYWILSFLILLPEGTLSFSLTAEIHRWLS